MSNLKTLREICDLLEVSRRTVQGYEKAKLVSAVGKNKYGHLLYGEDEVNRIKKIRLFQQFGFKIREIPSLMDAPNDIMKEAMERQVKKMCKEKKHLDTLIKQAKIMIEELL